MDRTTLYLDPPLKRRLKRAAARKGTTEAALLREALERYLAAEKSPKLRPVGRSADGGVAHRTDEALADLGFGQR